VAKDGDAGNELKGQLFFLGIIVVLLGMFTLKKVEARMQMYADKTRSTARLLMGKNPIETLKDE